MVGAGGTYLFLSNDLESKQVEYEKDLSEYQSKYESLLDEIENNEIFSYLNYLIQKQDNLYHKYRLNAQKYHTYNGRPLSHYNEYISFDCIFSFSFLTTDCWILVR